MLFRDSVRSLSIAAAVVLLAACAAQTSIVNQWEAPDRSPALKRVFVASVFQDASVRRTFEDQVAAALAARGVEAIPGYRYLPEDGPVSSDRLAAAVRASGASGVLFTRVLKVDRQTTLIATAPTYWGPTIGYAGWYPGAWGPVYAYPMVQAVTTDTVIAEVRLYRAADQALVWAATTQTFNPSNPAKDSAQFADVIVTQLAQKGLI